MMARTTKKRWSYLSGEKGRNRVRAYERASGALMMEFRDRGLRKRIALDHRDRDRAKRQADEAASRLAKTEVPGAEKPKERTLGELFEMYLGEVTPKKSDGVQRFDKAAAERLNECLGRNRKPSQLSKREWDLFIQERQSGRLTGRIVGARTVARDLKFLSAVLNWATLASDGRGGALLDRNPLKGLPIPKERNPRRPVMTDELRRGLTGHSPSWQFALALLLERETLRRNSSIRRLRWSDVDLEQETVRWRAEFDKAGRENVTPLTHAAVAALRGAPSRGIGDAPVFPSAADQSKPTPRGTFQVWLRRAKARWVKATADGERPTLREKVWGVGFHSEKRAGVRDPLFRALPHAIQEAWAGTSYEVLRDVYDQVTPKDIRAAIRQLEIAARPSQAPERTRATDTRTAQGNDAKAVKSCDVTTY
ncbi:MAG: tyrosine-type recombinase/integrase [Deltaproteobacteria bacterium]|nr:tyrosine-type recombinase/integrase [Deltaproteobacteria bacterium]